MIPLAPQVSCATPCKLQRTSNVLAPVSMAEDLHLLLLQKAPPASGYMGCPGTQVPGYPSLTVGINQFLIKSADDQNGNGLQGSHR